MKAICIFVFASILSISALAQSLSSDGQVSFSGTKTQLQGLGESVRAKKVAFMTFDVYRAKLWANDKSLLESKGELAILGVEQLQQIAIEMNFLRNVESEKIMTAFKEAIEYNSIENKGPIQEFISHIAMLGEIKKEQRLVILGSKEKDGVETIYLQMNQTQIAKITGPKGFISQIFSIWLGKTGDENLAKLKKELLKNK